MTDTQRTAGNTATDNFCTPENRAFYESALYQPLDNNAREVRMVTLSLASQGHEQLELTLEDKLPLASFGDSTYALSYAAGAHTQTEVIRVSAGEKNAEFNAFATLAKALRALRDLAPDVAVIPDAVRHIWADQICINQSDPDERAYQVEHMREIYQSVDATVIYLGEDKYDGRALAYLKTVIEYCSEGLSRPSDNEWNDVLNQAAEWIVEHVRNPDHADDWWAVRALFEAPWWKRGWVCQEAVVSANAVIFHGSSAMHIAPFTVAATVFLRARRNLIIELRQQIADRNVAAGDLNLVHSFDPNQVDFILQTSADWWERKNTAFEDIKPLLRHARNCETGDPRDRVYAFIGLADPAYCIKPSYKLGASETFMQTAACIIRKGKRLQVVFDAMHNSGMPDLPSWAADWTTPTQRTRLLYQAGFSASGDHPVRVAIAFPQISSEFCGPVLRIEVLELGRLSIPERFGRAEDDRRTTLGSWGRIAGFRGEEMHDDPYVGGGNLDYAFTSTLLFGGNVDDEVLLDDLAGSSAHITSLFASYRRFDPLEDALEGEWSYFVTASDYMGLAVSNARHDDDLCIALGASVPMVLRRKGDHYSFIGEAYVHGLMHGEAIEMWEKGLLSLQTVDLV